MVRCAQCGERRPRASRYCANCGDHRRASSLRVFWIMAVAAVVFLVVGSVILKATNHADGPVTVPAVGGNSTPPDSSGSNTADTSALHSDCANGDMASCDTLYHDSPSGSTEETFGSTCGGRYSEQTGDCDSNYGAGSSSADSSSLHSECAGGDMSACDSLYYESPSGSSEEEFGSTCGGQYSEQDGDCELNYG